jgi:hypothetical protein
VAGLNESGQMQGRSNLNFAYLFQLSISYQVLGRTDVGVAGLRCPAAAARAHQMVMC